MRNLLQDLRFGLRLLRRSPAFTAVAVQTLALGIAVNTTVFSWIDGVLLRPFPGARDSHQLAVLEGVRAGVPNGANQISFADYLDYRRHMSSLSGLALHRDEVFSVGEGVSAQARWGELVSANYFDVLRVQPVLGRAFTTGHDTHAEPVAVISYRLWEQRFRSDAAVVGKVLRVNQRDLIIVGVAPPEFRGTMPGLMFDIWVPASMGIELGILRPGSLQARASRGFYAIARLRPGATIPAANAEAVALARNLEVAYTDTNTGVSATVLPVWRFHGGAPELLLKPLLILMGVSVLLMVIVCANLANLLLARTVARRKEFGVRLALGAGGLRISRQLLTETLLLACAGAVVGLAITPWLSDMLPALVPDVNAPIALGFQLSFRILTFTAATCLAAALLAGMIPAFFWFRSDVNRSLQDGGRGGSPSLQSHRTRTLLVISEVALACVALICAGIFLRAFDSVRNIHPGFDRNNVILARFYLNGAGFSPQDFQQFPARLRERLASAPGISDITYADFAPLGSSAGPFDAVRINGYTPERGESLNINRYLVAPGYFDTLRIPLVDGRDFTAADDVNAPPVIIVNQEFAKRYFDGHSPVGRQVVLGDRTATIVGVARNSKYFHVSEAPRPHFFAPFAQRARPGQQLFFFIRTSREPLALMQQVRRQVIATDPRAASVDLTTLTSWTEVTMLPQKVTASMAAALGFISLALAGVGLYSVMAYSVTQRTREIGIRLALGASPRSVLGDVVRRGAALTAAGILFGAIVAAVTLRVLAATVIPVHAADPLTYVGACAFLLLIGLLASYVPARRAIKVDPVTALRCE